MEAIATNFPHGLVARAEMGELWAILLISKKLDVSHNWRKLGSLDLVGLVTVKSRGRRPSPSPTENLAPKHGIMCYTFSGTINDYFLDVLISQPASFEKVLGIIGRRPFKLTKLVTIFTVPHKSTAIPGYTNNLQLKRNAFKFVPTEQKRLYSFTFWLSGLKSTSSTSFSWAFKSLNGFSVGNCHRRRYPSSPPVANNLPLELILTTFWNESSCELNYEIYWLNKKILNHVQQKRFTPNQFLYYPLDGLTFLIFSGWAILYEETLEIYWNQHHCLYFQKVFFF